MFYRKIIICGTNEILRLFIWYLLYNVNEYRILTIFAIYNKHFKIKRAMSKTYSQIRMTSWRVPCLPTGRHMAIRKQIKDI